jgi:hypothetical protein
MWALARQQLRLEGCATYEEALERIGGALAASPPGGWLLGHGWRSLEWTPPREPTRWDLDAVSGDVAVALRSKDGHSLWLNSAALARADGSLDVPGGVVEVDASGRPTGLLREEAAWAFEQQVVDASIDHRVDAVRAALALAHSVGVTAIHDKDGGKDALGTWQRLGQEGSAKIRVWQSLPQGWLGEVAKLGLRGGIGDGFLRVGYLKAFMDGSLGSRTARRLDGSGVSISSREDLEDLIRDASELGWNLAVHAIGDRANRDALDAFAATRDVWHPAGMRPRIEHAQLIDPADLPRFAEIGVAASVQFSHAASDRDMVDSVWVDVAGQAYPFRSLVDNGTLLANGSDAPIEELDPLLGIRTAVTRTLDDRPPWHPEQALTVQEALEATTSNPAWLSGDEHSRGRLLPGMFADLVVLNRDPVACPTDELGELRVVATMVGGEWVYGGPPWNDHPQPLGATGTPAVRHGA